MLRHRIRFFLPLIGKVRVACAITVGAMTILRVSSRHCASFGRHLWSHGTFSLVCTLPTVGWCLFFIQSILFIRSFVIHTASFQRLRFVPFHIASSFRSSRVGMRLQVTTNHVLVLRICLMMLLVFTSFHSCTIHVFLSCIHVFIFVPSFHRDHHWFCRSTSIPCRAHAALVSSIQSASTRRAFDHTRYVNTWQRGRKEGRRGRAAFHVDGRASHASHGRWGWRRHTCKCRRNETKRNTSATEEIERRTDTCGMDGRGCGHVDRLRIFQVHLHLRYDRREQPCERG